MQLQIFDDLLVRANTVLAALTFDETVSLERVAKCQSAAADLEAAVGELLTEAWIPRSIPALTFSIASIIKNLRRVQSDIDDCISEVIERGLADEYFRVWTAMAFSSLLELQKRVMIDVLAETVKNAPQSPYVN